MPSSLIFAALAGAWLVVLVPMIAKKRQEVARTTESALAARVLRRPDPSRTAIQRSQEMSMIGQIAQPEPPVEERRYRAGRGGYDPEAAQQLARAKYVFRQRVVLGLVCGALAMVVLACALSGLLWWVHAALDLATVVYLGYLRRQVRIEKEVRQRRAARVAGPRARTAPAEALPEIVPESAHPGEQGLQDAPVEPDGPQPLTNTRAVALDSDDEDPIFDELRPVFEPPYRRAVGE